MSVAIVEQYVNGEMLLDLGYAVLVASQSSPGSWYECREGRCTCKGFEMRGKCRHVDAVAALRQQHDPVVVRAKELLAENPTADFIRTVKQAAREVEDRAAQVAEQQMKAPASLAIGKEEWL